MKTPHEIVRTLLWTEKGVKDGALGKYHFEVEQGANKIQIRRAVEELFKVKVMRVNTMVMPGKRRRVVFRRVSSVGYRPQRKKAIVTLAAGQKIEVAPGVTVAKGAGR